MKVKAIVPLVLGLGMGLLAVKFGMDTIKRAKGSSADVAQRQVVRAKQDIDVALEITPEMVEVVSTRDKADRQDADFDKMENVVKRVTAKFIPQGAVITGSMLAEPGTAPGVTGRIREGFRAVGVKIDEVTGVAFNVKPGDWVDVIVVMDVQSVGSRQRETIAEVVLEHVEVAAVGLSTGTVSAESSGSKTKTARSVTLLVPERDVTKLHLAATRGKITLAMRGEADVGAGQSSYTVARSSEVFNGAEANAGDDTEDEEDAPSAEVPPPMGVGEAVDEWFAEQGINREKLKELFSRSEPASNPDPPFTMIVSRGSTLSGMPARVQRIIYENARSNKVIAVGEGLQDKGNLFQSQDAPSQTSQTPERRSPASSSSRLADRPDVADEDEEKEREERDWNEEGGE